MISAGVSTLVRMARVERSASRAERRLGLLGGVQIHPPLRLPRRQRLVGGPGGEALVQPDVVPPLHRHQVAEPLVGDLVGDDRGHRLERVHRRRRLVGQQQPLAEGDGAGVLHRPGGEVGDADDVELAEGVGDAEVVVEELHLVFGGLQREGGELVLVGRGADANRRSSAATPSRHTKSPTSSATRYVDIFGVRAKVTRVLARFGPGRVGELAAVGDRRVGGVDHQRDVEGGLLRRLVERREGAARVGGLHLAHRVVAAVGLAQIEAAQLVVEDAGVGDADRGRAGRHPLRHA